MLASGAAEARSVAVSLVDSPGLSEAQARRAVKAAENAVDDLSGLSLQRQPAPKRGAPRRSCGDELPARSPAVPPCLAALAVATGADHALLLSLRSAGGRLIADGFFVDEGQVRHQRLDEAGDDLDKPVRALVEALLPAWARKGWGGLTLSVPPGALLKVDGKKVAFSAAEPLALTAQVHSLDVLFEGGQAVMQRLHVPEGEALSLEVAPAPAVDASLGATAGHADERLRAVSYGLWGAGVLAIAGSLVAGAQSRRVAADLATCQGTSRGCLPYDQAQSRRQQAEAYARTGNVLLGVGAALAAGGVGLFAFDEVRAGAGR
jgi:hypothetical protein